MNSLRRMNLLRPTAIEWAVSCTMRSRRPSACSDENESLSKVSGMYMHISTTKSSPIACNLHLGSQKKWTF